MTRKSEQLPLAFGHEPQTGRDDLLVSDPLSAAVSIVDNWPNWPSPVVICSRKMMWPDCSPPRPASAFRIASPSSGLSMMAFFSSFPPTRTFRSTCG